MSKVFNKRWEVRAVVPGTTDLWPGSIGVTDGPTRFRSRAEAVSIARELPRHWPGAEAIVSEISYREVFRALPEASVTNGEEQGGA